MSLSRMLAGRKKDSPVWEFFEYEESSGKTKCIVQDKERSAVCGTKLSGKNSTNLIAHLQRMHKGAYVTYLSKAKNKIEAKCDVNPKFDGAPAFTKTQTLGDCIQRRLLSWPNESKEHQERQKAVLAMFVGTGYPLTLVDQPVFRDMITTLDQKFKLPSCEKIKRLLKEQYESASVRLKSMLSLARRISICLDGWTKKGFTGSFLGISACFYDTTSQQPKHVFLNLTELEHPHTGEVLAACLQESLQQWDIKAEQVLIIISDNGANMLKAIRLLQAQIAVKQKEDEDNDEEYNTDENESSRSAEAADEIIEDSESEHATEQLNLDLPPHIPYRQMSCMTHTLQLVIKLIYNHYNVTITNARQLVSKLRKSSVAVEKLTKLCGKTVITDCTTRWNSTHQMLRRLLEIKPQVNSVLAQLEMDSLLVTEWNRLEDIEKLLKPFAEITDVLQTDSQSLSSIIPSILDLEIHLQHFPSANSLTASVLCDMHRRFAAILQPDSDNFNPIPAAACFLDPTLGRVLQAPELSPLLNAAKMYITSLCDNDITHAGSEIDVKLDVDTPPALKRFKYLSSKLLSQKAVAAVPGNVNMDTVRGQMNRYVADAAEVCVTNPMEFWKGRHGSYSKIACVAEDLLSAPASQAFVERIFSLCGLLTSGRRNRMHKSLEIRVFLKLNNHLLT